MSDIFPKIKNSLPSKQTVDTIKKYEGLKTAVYPDAAGHSTIGYGHKLKPNEVFNKEISQEEADNLLTRDIQDHQKWKNKIQGKMSPNQEAAITSLAFNLGPNSQAIRKIADLMNQNKHKEAASVFNKYNKVRDPKTKQLVENSGLTERRNFETSLFNQDLPDESDTESQQLLAGDSDSRFDQLNRLLRGE